MLKMDFGDQFSETVRVGIVIAMMLESIQEFLFSSLGALVQYDSIIVKIRAVVSNKVTMADGPMPVGSPLTPPTSREL